MKKAIVFILSAAGLWSCYSGRELQADIVNAQLVKIDTVYRYSSAPQQLLTWRLSNNVEYVSYASIHNRFVLGARMNVLVTK